MKERLSVGTSDSYAVNFSVKSLHMFVMQSYDRRMKALPYSLAAALFVLWTQPVLGAEKDSSNNSLTQGMVQMTLKVGATSQLEVLEAFGAPNLTTLDSSGDEVWVYDRHATVSSSGSSGFSIGMLAGDSGVGGGLGFGSSKKKSTQSQRTMTLIIKFGPNKLVTDFKSRSSSF